MLLSFNGTLGYFFKKVEKLKLVELIAAREHMTGGVVEVSGLILGNIGKGADVSDELLEHLPIAAKLRRFF